MDITREENKLKEKALRKIHIKIWEVLYALISLWVRIIMVPVSYPMHWGITFVQKIYRFVKKTVKMAKKVVFKVGKWLQMGSFGDRLHYAVLKGNGQYLKIQGKSLESVLTCQLYDYSIRKFMTVRQPDSKLKVAQIQFWSNIGLNFLHEQLGLTNLTALTNSQQRFNKFDAKSQYFNVIKTDYSVLSDLNPQDIFLFFNRQMFEEIGQIDMMKILGYMKANISEGGFIVLGNYFTTEEQIIGFEEMLQGFRFKVEAKQDISKNMAHSKKVLLKIHQNRKVAWTVCKLKQYIVNALEKDNAFSKFLQLIWSNLQNFSGTTTSSSKYIVFILEQY